MKDDDDIKARKAATGDLVDKVIVLCCIIAAVWIGSFILYQWMMR